MTLSLEIGDLVECSDHFEGIAKVVSLDEIVGAATVAFFESPMRAQSRQLDVELTHLSLAKIFDEAVVYLLDIGTGIWRRARYGSQRPNGNHLVIFSQDDMAVVPIADIYIINLPRGSGLNPVEFMSARCCDTPFFTEWRLPFLRSYIEQRASCKSISSILSSSVEIEPHQIAVVRRVLEDTTKKYLLADEVGLGKTIEACLIIREHVLKDETDALVLIAVPKSLIGQWRAELTDRFYLGDLLDERLFVCSHEQLQRAVGLGTPTMIVIDEAHLVAPWAWSEAPELRSAFGCIAQAATSAESCLLLSGTPLAGNETNFLAMLHILAPEIYQLTEAGILSFRHRLAGRERLGGLYQALVPTNDNESLTNIVEETSAMFPSDENWQLIVKETKPFIDWSAPETSDKKTRAIGQLRKYLGETYRLHQRMLRNRREDPAIAGLFPGLAGASMLQWKVDERSLSVDQIIDAYREEYFAKARGSGAVNTDNLIEWFELYLTSPILVTRRAQDLLRSHGGQLSTPEQDLLQELIDCGEFEQKEKDRILAEFLSQWFAKSPKRKAIVFCGDEELADRVYEELRLSFGESVERHKVEVTPEFQKAPVLRVLVCDHRGEDGLNLHGGEKVIIHYSVPLSFSRIEQRNGRVNRYSATVHAKPIVGVVLLPNRAGFFTQWVALLDDAIRIFNRSVASLQYVLQEQIDNTLRRLPAEGLGPLRELTALLVGADGLLERERRRVSAQEELDSMNEEVEGAKTFATELRAADEAAEEQSHKMIRWICKGLQFTRTPGDVPGSFRFRFSTGAGGPRTLVDVGSFLKSCITGIDKKESDWAAPVTAMMSPNRELVTHGRQVYPMRYGQPFVDTIFDLSRTDSRGISSALLRAAADRRIVAPQVFFSLSGVVDGCPDGASRLQQHIADEKLPPTLYSHWLDESGASVVQQWILDLLSAPYSKSASRSARGIQYQDVRVRHDAWGSLESYFPSAEWPKLVQRVANSSIAIAERCGRQKQSIECAGAYCHPESISAVILLGSVQ
jgi:ATP-dependent helicase HepA